MFQSTKKKEEQKLQEKKRLDMYRSASTSRASDEFYMNMAAQAMGGSYQAGGLRSTMDMDQHLPTYNPQSDVAKKESSRTKVAENMVHVIPFVLVFCTIILWFFSHPAAEISAVSKDDSMVAKIKNADGDRSWNGSSMAIDMKDLDHNGGHGKDKSKKQSKIKVKL